MEPMNPQIIPELLMDARTDENIRRNLCRCFPADREVFSKTRKWHDSGPAWTVLIREKDEVIAHAGFVDRTIRVDRDMVRIAGVQNVFVLPEYRGRGLSDAVMQAGIDYAQTQGFDLGLLFCAQPVVSVYSRMGWSILTGVRIILTDETGRDVQMSEKNVTMFYPLKRSLTPGVTIHLQGNDW